MNVFIKTVPLYNGESQEFEIWKLLNSEKMRSDPRNRTVPVREILFFSPDFAPTGFPSTKTDTRAFVVMEYFPPLMEPRPIDDAGHEELFPSITSIDKLLELSLDVLQVRHSLSLLCQRR